MRWVTNSGASLRAGASVTPPVSKLEFKTLAKTLHPWRTRCKETYSFKETLEELNVLVHGVHLGLQLHLVGISRIHILKEDAVIHGHHKSHQKGDIHPQPSCLMEEGDIIFSCVAHEEGRGSWWHSPHISS